MFTIKRTIAINVNTFFLLSSIALLTGCQSYQRNKSHADVSLSSIKKGKTLAAVHCQSCHALPDPSLLNAESWEKGVLPVMGPRLGIFRHNFQSYPSAKRDKMVGPGFYPATPAVTAAEWQNIIDYYTATSPDSLHDQKRARPIKMNLPLFNVQHPVLSYKDAMTSFVKINEGNPSQRITISDAVQEKLFFLNASLQLTDSVQTNGPVVDLELFQNTMLVCNIGVMNPNNGAFGKATYLHTDTNNRIKQDTGSLFENLRRPVQISAGELNNDGKEDLLLCEFGFLSGSLSWMENKGKDQFVRHVLRSAPGATKAYLQDYNKDGNMDIWVLFGQGEEGIFLFTNKSNGNFSERQVLRFPPVYGSSYLELADFNKDGYPDIVYTCGDNADYSMVQKPYHGVYVFLNDGRNTFKQNYFFPMHGCYKAMARDFDGDGDLDIAAIAYFADYKNSPEEGFVYLENEGRFHFQPYSIEAAKAGRWLTMDAGDVDSDGRIDLVLGNFSLGPSLSKSFNDWRQAPPFILLKNTGKK